MPKEACLQGWLWESLKNLHGIAACSCFYMSEVLAHVIYSGISISITVGPWTILYEFTEPVILTAWLRVNVSFDYGGGSGI